MSFKRQRRRLRMLLGLSNDEGVWRAWAVALALCSAMGVIAAVIFIRGGQDVVEMAARVQILTPFAVFYAGLITFCTVVWRGLISARQADSQLETIELQRIQIAKLSQQMVAAEESSLADHLQKGAELLADERSKSRMAAGIAILQSIITAPNAKFSVEAADLLADFVQANYSWGSTDPIVHSAISALAKAEMTERPSSRRLSFSGRHMLDEASVLGVWDLLRGVQIVRYTAGAVEGWDMEKQPIAATRYTFRKTLFEDCRVDLRVLRPIDCRFRDCYITGFGGTHIKKNTFVDCDFSGAEVRNMSLSTFPDLREGGNYYHSDNPPEATRTLDWSKRLNVIVALDEFEALDDEPS